MSKQSAPEPEKAPSFEQNLAELEAVVKQLEGSDLPLERSLELFERGMQLSEVCRKQLQEAEMRVEMLVKKGRQVIPAPIDPEGP